MTENIRPNILKLAIPLAMVGALEAGEPEKKLEIHSEICTSLSEIKNGTTEAIIWRVQSGNQIKERVIMTIKQPAFTSKINILDDSKTVYAWTTPDKHGTKYKKASGIGNLQSDEKSNEKCKPWTPDYSLFNAPPNIRFTEQIK